jgi:serine kinase of HPr protein (carbohydrate metabolism regulator)
MPLLIFWFVLQSGPQLLFLVLPLMKTSWPAAFWACCAIGGRGVLITGVSGAGKTTLALALARRGHKWIADDAVEIEKRCDGRLYGKSHALVKNLLNIKDIGVLQVEDLLAAACITDESPVDMIARIGTGSESKHYWARSDSRIMEVRLPLVKIMCSKDREGQLEHAAKIVSQTG